MSLHASSLHFPPPHPLTNHHPSPITHPTTPYPPLAQPSPSSFPKPPNPLQPLLQFPPKPSSHTPTVDIVDIVTRFRRKIPHFRSNLPSLLTVVPPRLHLPFLPVGNPISQKNPHPHSNTPYKQTKRTKTKTKRNETKNENGPTSSPPPLMICFQLQYLSPLA